jgi:hypothetical protein
VFGLDPLRARSLRLVGVVALCALAALFVALAAPSRARAARVHCDQVAARAVRPAH